MSKKRSTNIITVSVRRRLYNLSRQRGEDFQLVLTRYAIERMLYRLAQSKHSDQFILRGGMLLKVWMDRSYRPTRDLDFAGQGDASPERWTTLFREICRRPESFGRPGSFGGTTVPESMQVLPVQAPPNPLPAHSVPECVYRS